MASTPAKLPRSAALVGTPSSAPEPAAEDDFSFTPTRLGGSGRLPFSPSRISSLEIQVPFSGDGEKERAGSPPTVPDPPDLDWDPLFDDIEEPKKKREPFCHNLDRDGRERYTRVFATQYGGFSYHVTKAPVKPRYLDFEKKRPQRTLKMREKMSSDEFRDKVETGARNNAMAFEDADENMDGLLSFKEFRSLVRSRLPSSKPRSKAQMAAWFNALDTDGSGQLSQAEFFCFSLRESFLRANSGKSMEEFFKHFDRGGDGTLDRNEFTKLAERMGFGAAAEELMQQCDKDGTGYISYTEFLGMLRDRTSSGDTKSFIMAATMADEEKADEAFPPLLLAPARTDNEDEDDLGAALQEEMRETLLMNGQEVMELFKGTGTDIDEPFTVDHLGLVMQHLEVDVPASAVQELHAELDHDATTRDDGGLTHGKGDTVHVGLTLRSLNAWMLENLDTKEEVQQILREKLRKNSTQFLEMFTKWDSDGQAGISVGELGDAIQSIGFDTTEEIVEGIFDDLDQDGSGVLALSELKRWLFGRLDTEEQAQQAVRDALRSNGARLMRVFAELGKEATSAISVNELGLALEALGFEAPNDAVNIVFDEIDNLDANEDDDMISIMELNKYLLRKVHTKKQLRKELREGLRRHSKRAIELFRIWDVDGDALLTEEEFCRALKELGFHVNKKVMLKLYDELDEDANNRLDFTEFNRWLGMPPQPKKEEKSGGKHRKHNGKEKATDKEEERRKKVAKLLKACPHRTEADVKLALNKSKGNPQEAMKLLAGTAVLDSLSSLRAMNAAESTPTKAGGPLTPQTIIAAGRRRRHEKVSVGRADAMKDLDS